jgi:hypothetical protein
MRDSALQRRFVRADTRSMLDQPLSQRLREIRETHAPPAPELEPLQEAPRRLPLGELLIEKGLLTEPDLILALAHQRHDGRPLGQILISMGVLTEQELARTLAEQHGFDFSMSLRRRLAPVARPKAEHEPAEGAFEPEPEQEPVERYLVREPGHDDSLHVADSFLDAADAAFELIDERDPAELEIVRARDGEFEHLWSYNRAASQPLAS